MRILASEKRILEVYLSRIMSALDEVNTCVEQMDNTGYFISVGDAYGQIIDEVVRIRKLYKLDKDRKEDETRGRKRKEI